MDRVRRFHGGRHHDGLRPARHPQDRPDGALPEGKGVLRALSGPPGLAADARTLRRANRRERRRHPLIRDGAFMKVHRIVANVATSDVDKASAFYKEILGLDVLMDLGWIRTYGSGSKTTVQMSVMSEGGSGTAVPDMSIEVDNVEEALMRRSEEHT